MSHNKQNSNRNYKNNHKTLDCSIIQTINNSKRKHHNSKSLQIAHSKENDDNFIQDYQYLLNDLKIHNNQNFLIGASLKIKKKHAIDETKKKWLASSAKNIFSYKNNEPKIRLSYNPQSLIDDNNLQETDKKFHDEHNKHIFPNISQVINQPSKIDKCLKDNQIIPSEDTSPGQIHLKRLTKRNKSNTGCQFIGTSFKTSLTNINNHLNQHNDILSLNDIILKPIGRNTSTTNIKTSLDSIVNPFQSQVSNILNNHNESGNAFKNKFILKKKKSATIVYKICPYY